jgi:hypothetical protein
VWGGAAGLVTSVVTSFFTRPPAPENLAGLVWGHAAESAHLGGTRWYRTPAFLGAIVLACYLALNVIFR